MTNSERSGHGPDGLIGVTIRRRSFLRIMCGGGVATQLLLSACSVLPGVGGGGATATPSTGVAQLPTHIPIQGPQPDIPGSADGNVDAVYKTFPQKQFQSVKQAPGDGSEISVMAWTSGPPPSLSDDNASLQAISKDANVKFNLNLTGFIDYQNAKLPTIIAGGDLPDLISFVTDPTVVLLPEFFEQKCVDLTPYVSGDAIKDYPNLAAIPTRPWKTTIFNGKIFGVPQPLRPYFFWFWVHEELLDQAGLQQPRDAQDFKEQVQQLTKPQQNLYGMGVEGGPQFAYDTVDYGVFSWIFKAPNHWAVDSNGKFTSSYETDQFKAAVAYVRDLYAANIFHPDSANWNTLSARDAFIARKMVYRSDGLESNYWLQGPELTPPANIKVVAPFSNDGSTPVYFFGRPNFGFTSIKKGTPDARVRMLLRVLDYLAAPFGSEEYTLLHYGVKGVDYNPDDKGNPVVTDKGKSDIIPWNALVGPTPVLYTPLSSTKQAELQEAEKVLYAAGLEDASVGLYSRTLATKNPVLVQNIGDGLNAIIRGQRPMTDYDQILKEWQDGGGAQAKIELQQSYAASKG